MEPRAAILCAQNHEWSVEEIEIAGLGPDEVLVKTAYAGLCQSDEHLVTSDISAPDKILRTDGCSTARAYCEDTLDEIYEGYKETHGDFYRSSTSFRGSSP